ncbi:MAG TPA: hypothetical protein VIK61_13115 [Acidimicrobiia bacterium]
MSFDTIATSPVGTRMLDRLVSDGFPSARPLSDLSEAALYRIAFEAAVEVSSEKWSARPGRSEPWERRESAGVVDQLARAVPTCAAARWWSFAATRRPQVWLGRAADTPAEGVLAPHIAGKPRTEIWTSSAVEGLPSAWWPYLERGADGPMPGPRSIWRLTPGPDARVFEIRTPADWLFLCETFPGPVVDGWVVPGWDAAAEHFDAIHLTVEGLVRVQGVRIETTRGPAMLDNWDTESTAWLRWSIGAVERLGGIRDPTHRSEPSGRAPGRALRRS